MVSIEYTGSTRLPESDRLPTLQQVPPENWDLAQALALSRNAGWNQCSQDWQFMLEQGDNWALYDGHHNLVGSALEVPFDEKLSWISMMLIDERWRGKNLAGPMVESCIRSIEFADRVCGLDAAERAISLYQRAGFEKFFAIHRFQSNNRTLPVSDQVTDIVPCTPQMLPALTALDAGIVGAPRSLALDYLLMRSKGAGLYRSGDRSGFCLGRSGDKAFQIGPVNAVDLEVAIALFEQALSALGEQSVIIDVPEYQSGFAAYLSKKGFQLTRRFVRMYRSGQCGPSPDLSGQLFATAGPDLG